MTQDADALGNARLMVAEEECQEEGGRILRLARHFQSRKIEWNEFCDHVRGECVKALDMKPAEAGKLKLEELIRLAKKVEDAKEGRI